MLVLSRKSGETIAVGDQIQITVLEVRGNQVKLGLAAPREVPIRRGELELEPHVPQAAEAVSAMQFSI